MLKRSHSPDVQVLFEEWPAGHNWALSRLIEINLPEWHAKAKCKLKCDKAPHLCTPEDLVQEALANMLEYLENKPDYYNDGHHFIGTFYVQLEREIIGLGRGFKRKRNRTMYESELNKPSELDTSDWRLPRQNDETWEEPLWAAMASLRRGCFAATWFYHFEECRQCEIAGILRCHERTVRTLLAKAKTILKSHLAAPEELLIRRPTRMEWKDRCPRPGDLPFPTTADIIPWVDVEQGMVQRSFTAASSELGMTVKIVFVKGTLQDVAETRGNVALPDVLGCVWDAAGIDDLTRKGYLTPQSRWLNLITLMYVYKDLKTGSFHLISPQSSQEERDIVSRCHDSENPWPSCCSLAQRLASLHEQDLSQEQLDQLTAEPDPLTYPDDVIDDNDHGFFDFRLQVSPAVYILVRSVRHA